MHILVNNVITTLKGAGGPAASVDSAFIFIAAICAFFFLLTQGLLISFAVKYRKRRASEHNETPYITGNRFLETVWVIIPSLVVIAIFVYGYVAYNGMMRVSENAMEVDVTARQWMWEFVYPNGRKTVNELRVAFGEPVKLRMGSEDVIHSFYVPDYRIKRDIVPGSFATIGFTPGPPGEHRIFCAEYCGTGHSNMNATLIVMEPDEFEDWLESEDAEGAVTPAELGARLVKEYGCVSCHTTDGTKSVGPSFAGLYGRKVEFEDGSSVTADEDYILESMVEPKAKVVKGYTPVMPTYKGSLSADERNAIIAYLRSLGGQAPATDGRDHTEGMDESEEPEESEEAEASAGEKLFNTLGCRACHSVDGSRGVGPTLKGLKGSNRKFTDGSSVTADEAYIRESIMKPNEKTVEGFPPVMPSFEGRVTDEDLADLAAYIETL